VRDEPGRATAPGALPSSDPPASTYRVQLSAGFTFHDVAALVPYLASLGISACYSSPILAARPGSPHGYDITDHSRLNPELGGETGFAALAAALSAHRMTLLVDHVPNHMALDAASNRWWRDVLESGPSSPFARFFDVDWEPVKPTLRNKVLLPLLGDQYGVALENGDLQIVFTDGVFGLRYGEQTLPLNPREWRRLLRHDLDRLVADAGTGDPDLIELESLLFHLDHIPVYTDTSAEQVVSRSREKEVARQRLATLLRDSAAVRKHVEANVRLFNGTPGDAASFDQLHQLLERQVYRLAYWRAAMHEINYRRFFDVNQLAGIRVEDSDVFAETHALLARLVASAPIAGLRIDHIDGLFDPAAYIERLRGLLAPAQPYLVVEKILSPGESIPVRWPVHGTTGYDFMNDVNGLFVDSRNAQEFARLYRRVTGVHDEVAEVLYTCKKLVLTTSLASELNVLAHEADRISEHDRRSRDFTIESLREALAEVVASFPVYRTHVGPEGWTRFDEACVGRAVAAALQRTPASEPSIFHFIRQLLLPAATQGGSAEDYGRRLRFAMKFQQYTGPVHAKGVEDTAFYRYAPLLSLNEVGGDPETFGRPPAAFHRANRDRQRAWPGAMLATSTHDAKRGEDARVRISVLSEIPREWRTAVSRWMRANQSARVRIRGERAPDARDEYLFYQALIGAWPPGLDGAPDAAFVDRMQAYMRKAIREAKVRSSWINPSAAYDDAMTGFVSRVLTGPRSHLFLELFLPFVGRVSALGAVNSLSQLVLKLASPGVADFYQGAELWDLALVDPDNRRPVDYRARQGALADLDEVLGDRVPPAQRAEGLHDLLAGWPDGRIKLYVTAQGLRLRRTYARVFLEGDYVPLAGRGERAAHVIAFARVDAGQTLIAIATRLAASLLGWRSSRVLPTADTWGDLAVPVPAAWLPRRYHDALSGESHAIGGPAGRPIRVAEILRHLPATLLIGGHKEDSGS
jgi:(1->4)-alpha-D-glucan 1-alpha-D-glucosylmutase